MNPMTSFNHLSIEMVKLKKYNESPLYVAKFVCECGHKLLLKQEHITTTYNGRIPHITFKLTCPWCKTMWSGTITE